MSRITKYLARLYSNCARRLTQIRDTPHAVAGGVAIGLVCGFSPLFGFKTLLAVLVAMLFRCSKLSAALAVTIHDILLPIWPVILRWQFQTGYFLISRPHRLPPRFNPKHFHYENFFTMKTLHVLWPTLVGSVVLAAPLSVAGYFLVLGILKKAEAVKAGRMARSGGGVD